MAKKPRWYKGSQKEWNQLSPSQKKAIKQQHNFISSVNKSIQGARRQAAAFNKNQQRGSGLTEFRYIGVPGGEYRGPKGHFRGLLPGSPTVSVQHDPYAITGPQSFRMDQRRPLYVEGDQFKPANGGLTVDEIMDLQHKMDELGFYNPKDKYVEGQWDIVDAAAYEKVLAGANVNMQDASTYLQNLVDHPELIQDAGGGEDGTQNIITLTNPDEIRSVAKEVATSLYGEALPEATMQNLIDSFHNVEMEKQSQMNALEESGQNAVVTQGPSLDSYIEEQLRKREPEKVLGHDFGTHMDAVLQTLMTSPGE